MKNSEVLTRSFHDWSALQTRMVFVYDGPLPKGTSRGTYQRHGEYSGWLVRKGWARAEAGGMEKTIHAGEWLFCFAESIRQEFSRDVRLLSVRIRNCWPQDELLFQGRALLAFPASHHPALEELALAMAQDIRMPRWQGKNGDPQFTFLWKTRVRYEAFLEHQGHLLEWSREITETLVREGWSLRVPGGMDQRLAHVLNAIDAMDYRLPFPGKKLSGGTGLTFGQLNRLAVKACGKTLHAYWQQRRVEHARLLLGHQGLTVKETASLLGFSELSQFSEWFKRETGSAPRQFRNSPESIRNREENSPKKE